MTSDTQYKLSNSHQDASEGRKIRVGKYTSILHAEDNGGYKGIGFCSTIMGEFSFLSKKNCS